MMPRLEAIRLFLDSQPVKNPLWNPELETQVNVVPGQKDPKTPGLLYRNPTTGDTWYNFRIPKDAKSDAHYYDNKLMTYDLHKHAQGIGSTGWNWKQNISEWVGFDFDSIVNHTKGHSAETMNLILEKLKEIPWTMIRKSKSGAGFHVFVFINNSPSVTNHGLHAALARSILQQMSGLTGFNFSDGVDCVGQNMWLWHRDAKEGAYEIVKTSSEYLSHIPVNWADHMSAANSRVSKKRALIEALRKVDGITDENITAFVELQGQANFISLTDRHRKLISAVVEKQLGWWDAEHNCLVTHTKVLEEMHMALGFQGIFFTIASGRTEGDWNCFAMPTASGWIVRRYTKGCDEHPAWDKDTNGWTVCRFDTAPTFDCVVRAFKGIFGKRKDYEFETAEQAGKALAALGFNLELDPVISRRVATLANKKDMIIMEVPFEPRDPLDQMTSWRREPVDKPKRWIKVFKFREQRESQEIEACDNLIRGVRFGGRFEGYYYRTTNGEWMLLGRADLLDAIGYRGFDPQEVREMLGAAVASPWNIVTEPFQDEYLGDRKWNRGAAQLAYEPKEGPHPVWDKILQHMGAGLNDALLIQEPGGRIAKWLEENDVKNGGDYLKLWLACCFQRPKESLPYLSFFSKQEGTGKSTFHESLATLFAGGRGYVRADQAIRSEGTFNGELQGALLCVIEEVNLNNRKYADKIKDWVTSRTLSVHIKGGTPFLGENCTHWMQFSNHANYTPLFDGDTRIVMINVPPISQDAAMDGYKLHEQVKDENSAFTHTLVSTPLPERFGRLQLPVLETIEKQATMEASRTPMDVYLKSQVFRIPGALTNVSDFYHNAEIWIMKEYGNEVATQWTKNKIASSCPAEWLKGICGPERKTYFANISLSEDFPPGAPYRLMGRELVR